ncbi:MAG: hypothetical protein ACREBG_12920 [Pyrinomonadaceae bacterium]
MTFNEPEVVEMGLAEDLIHDELDPFNSEDVTPSRIKQLSATYVADAE